MPAPTKFLGDRQTKFVLVREMWVTTTSCCLAHLLMPLLSNYPCLNIYEVAVEEHSTDK